ncbi:MAG: hypothetical protein IH945_01950 [Armatimonadetes bacterium]|nr:hypothetical protein [Armatimonadota bacterium]
MVQSDSSGKIVRVLSFPHEMKGHTDAPDVAETVLVALTDSNIAKLRAIVNDSDAYTLVVGVVKKGAAAVTFEAGDDSHAAARSLHGVSVAQERTMLAGARAVIEKASTPGANNEEKAIGWIALRLMRLDE